MVGDTYKPISADSNFEPISIEIRRAGKLVTLAGLQAFITVKDEKTRATIVDNAVAEIIEPGVVQFHFTPAHVAKIKANGMWLVEWRIVDVQRSRTLRTERKRLPVLAPL